MFKSKIANQVIKLGLIIGVAFNGAIFDNIWTK